MKKHSLLTCGQPMRNYEQLENEKRYLEVKIQELKKTISDDEIAFFNYKNNGK